MRIRSEEAERNTSEDFIRRVQTLSDASATVLHVRTTEMNRAAETLRRNLTVGGNRVHEWTVDNGWKQWTLTSIDNPSAVEGDKQNISDALKRPVTYSQSGELDAFDDSSGDAYYAYFVFIATQFWMDNSPPYDHAVREWNAALPATNIRVILITPDLPLPQGIADYVTNCRFEAMGHGEMHDVATSLLENIESDILDLSEEDVEKACFAGSGMSKDAFELYLSLAIVEAASGDEAVTGDALLKQINVGKTEIVNKNDLLELYPHADLANVGGLENLKGWIEKRKACYSDEAQAFGIEPPKGIVLLGIPGTGKSLFAKSVAQEFGVPLIRLDIGRVFNSLVGKSEERMRTALNMIEAMSPCVLFVDEIDKGLGGITNGGGGDSGTSSRVLGTFLTWLQDNEKPVFALVTANNINGLPPELLRRGRFDAIFSADLPNTRERAEVLTIHLRLRDRDIKEMVKTEVKEFLSESDGYVGAEIEAAVKDGLIEAFSDGQEFTVAYATECLKRMTPLSKAYKSEIAEMRDWSKANAIPASNPEGVARTTAAPRRTPKTRRPRKTIN